MTEVDANTVKSLTQEWWNSWWDADYSWEGLAKKRWRGWYVGANGKPIKTPSPSALKKARPATLQDFWRAEEAKLITGPDGRAWTSAHVPETWSDGSPAKSTWTEEQITGVADAIDAALARLPENAFATTVSPRPRPTGTASPSALSRMMAFSKRWPIALDGAVLRTLPKGVSGRGYVQARQAAFADLIDLTGEASVDLRNSLFTGGLYADGQLLDVRLSQSVFLSETALGGVGFQSLQCAGTTFLYGAEFDQVSVAERADFTRARFIEGADFTQFKANEIRARLLRAFGPLDLSHVIAANALFTEGTFSGPVDLTEASFTRLDFTEAIFEAKAELRHLVVSERATFDTTLWKKKADFTGVTLQLASFASARFSESVVFTDATFRKKLTFAAAKFEGAAYFDAVTWPATLSDHEAAFREAHFDRFADFSTPTFKTFAAFDGAAFKGEVRFGSNTFRRDVGFRAALKLACEDKRHDALGHGLRSLKQAAEAVRDRASEQMFFRYELIARRCHPSTPRGEWLISWLYWLVSDYGDSIIRPLCAAFCLWVAGAAIYFSIELWAVPVATAGLTWWGPAHPATLEALQLSTRSIFSLFGVWNLRPPDPANAGQIDQHLEASLLWKDSTTGLISRLVSSVQSLLAGVLLFLTALAVRRRFQIS